MLVIYSSVASLSLVQHLIEISLKVSAEQLVYVPDTAFSLMGHAICANVIKRGKFRTLIVTRDDRRQLHGRNNCYVNCPRLTNNEKYLPSGNTGLLEFPNVLINSDKPISFIRHNRMHPHSYSRLQQGDGWLLP